ncbi:MAG TPA: fasciclin domain-containing protein [Gemmatimonadaceae bacterium]|nr:fasciclin domain-containing protein [Gemmatimonadaceae bacterium]
MRPTRLDSKAANAAITPSESAPASAPDDASADSPYKQAPAPERNILATAASGPFKTLARAIRAAGLGEMLSEKGPYTVFAPTDRAFSRMPKAELDALMQNRIALTELLRSHVVRNKVKAPQIDSPRSATTLHGDELTLTRQADGYRVNDAKILKTDIRASNGVLHAIDSVLSPR